MTNSAAGPPRFAASMAMAGVSLSVLAAVWLGFLAWKFASPGHGIAAIAAMLMASMFAATVLLWRVDFQAVEAQQDIAVVFGILERAVLSLRAIRIGRGLMSLTCAGLAILWAAEALAMVRVTEFLIPSTLICASAACFYLPWLATRERRIREEHATVLRRLKELKSQCGQGMSFTSR